MLHGNHIVFIWMPGCNLMSRLSLCCSKSKAPDYIIDVEYQLSQQIVHVVGQLDCFISIRAFVQASQSIPNRCVYAICS